MPNLFILALATWRISSLLVDEKGPLNIFERLRTLAGIEVTQLGDRPEYYKSVPDTFLAQLLDCVWCCSVWVGLFFSVSYFLLPAITTWMCLPFSLSTVAVLVNRFSK